MKRRLIALALTVCLILSVAPAALAASIQDFTDVKGHWGYSYIKWGVDEGIFNGMSATEFEPDTGMTRAMFVTTLGRMAEGFDKVTKDAADSKFTDVKAGMWYTQYVNWAAANKIVEGYPDGSFGVDRLITREEMCVVMMNFLTYLEENVENRMGKNTFADKADVSAWAIKGVNVCIGYELIEGMGQNMFKPKETATRAQVAALLSRLELTVESIVSGGPGGTPTHTYGDHTDAVKTKVAASTATVETMVQDALEDVVGSTTLPGGASISSITAAFANDTITVTIPAEVASVSASNVQDYLTILSNQSAASLEAILLANKTTVMDEARAYGDLVEDVTITMGSDVLFTGTYADYLAIYNGAGSDVQKMKDAAALAMSNSLYAADEQGAVDLAMDTAEDVLRTIAAGNDAQIELDMVFTLANTAETNNGDTICNTVDYTICIETEGAAGLSSTVKNAAEKAANAIAGVTYNAATDTFSATVDVSNVSYVKMLRMLAQMDSEFFATLKDTVEDQLFDPATFPNAARTALENEMATSIGNSDPAQVSAAIDAMTPAQKQDAVKTAVEEVLTSNGFGYTYDELAAMDDTDDYGTAFLVDLIRFVETNPVAGFNVDVSELITKAENLVANVGDLSMVETAMNRVNGEITVNGIAATVADLEDLKAILNGAGTDYEKLEDVLDWAESMTGEEISFFDNWGDMEITASATVGGETKNVDLTVILN